MRHERRGRILAGPPASVDFHALNLKSCQETEKLFNLLESSGRVENMEAALSLLIIEFSAPLWSLQIGCSWYPGSQSQPYLQPAPKMARWLASFWYDQSCPSLFVETKSVRSSGSNAASILSTLLDSRLFNTSKWLICSLLFYNINN